MTQKSFDLALLVPDADPTVGQTLKVKVGGDDFETEFGDVSGSAGAVATGAEVITGTDVLKTVSPKSLADASTQNWLPAQGPATGRYVRIDATGLIPAALLPTVDKPAIPMFDDKKDYVTDDLVVFAGKIYRAPADIAKGAWDATKWIDIHDALGIMPFDIQHKYFVDNIVTNGGKIYRAKADMLAGAWDATKWTLIADAAKVFTAGSIPFADTDGSLAEDNASLFWDNANKRLGIGTKTPATAFHVAGQLTAEYIHFGTDNNLLYQSAPNTISFRIGTGANQGYLAANVTGQSTMLSANGGTFDLGFGNGTAAVKTYSMSNVGQHVWSSVLSGVVSERMQLSTAGQLLIGTTTAPTVAGALLSVASDAQINGMTVGKGLGQVATNIAIGTNALAANTTGDSLVAIGALALARNQGGTSNVAVGRQALFSNTSGSNNVGVGTYSLVANVSGQNNTAVGANTLVKLTTGSGNCAVGSGTLAEATTSSFNTGFGFNCLTKTTTGELNCAFGQGVLRDNTVGKENTGFGAGSLLLNIIGNSNTAVGRLSLSSTNADNNTGVGFQSLYLNQSGVANTAIGYTSLHNNLSGSDNVGLGRRSGFSIVTGSGNVVIGGAPGEQAMSETIIISTGTGVERMRILADGKVGVGTSAPTDMFQVGGSIDNIRLGTSGGVSHFTLGSDDTAGNIGFYFDRTAGFGQIKFVNTTAGLNTTAMSFLTNGCVIGGTTKSPSAALSVPSTTQGFLPPVMTTAETKAIVNPVAGLTVYSSDAKALCFFDGAVWQKCTPTPL